MNYLLIEGIYVLLISIFSIFLLFKNDVFERHKNLSDFIRNNKIAIATSLLLIIFIAIRIFYIESIPYGLNRDEASAGYDAWSLMNYGVDRNLQSFPFYFKAWGDGQNALYTYILMPFIYFLGLNVFAVRLPMSIIYSISLVYFYLTLKNRFDKNKAFLGLLLYGTAPFTIMGARWGLESMLLVPMLVFIYYNFDKYLLNQNNTLNFYMFFILIGISCYCYATTFLVFPILLLVMFLYMCPYKKIIPVKDYLIGVMLSGIITLPLIIFVIINFFDLETVKIGIFTIPKLQSNRMVNVLNLNSIISGISNSILITFTRLDINYYLKDSIFGCFYPLLSIVFTAYGLLDMIRTLKDKSSTKYDLIACMIVPTLILMAVMQTNVNRINFSIFTFLILTIYGGISFCYKYSEDKKKTMVLNGLIVSIVSILFVLFSYRYFEQYQDPHRENINIVDFHEDIVNTSRRAAEKDKSIYLLSDERTLFIYYLFGGKINPNELKDAETFKTPYALVDYSNIGDRYFNHQNILLRKNSFYVIDEEFDKKVKQLEDMLKKANINYSVRTADYFTIIET